MAAVALALCAAALWGTGDFLGGFASRRMAVLTVLFWSQLAGLAGVVVWILVSDATRPGRGLLFAVGAGIAGVVGLGCLYRGLAVGAMGIVAPISATSPAIPLGVDLLRGHSPTAQQWLGVGLALVGVGLVSREPGGTAAPASRAGRSRPGSAWRCSPPSASGSSSSASARRPGRALRGRPAPRASGRSEHWCSPSSGPVPCPACRNGQLPLVLAVGAFDTGANALIALAAARGSIGIVAVLSSLYPIATILLARAILRERLGAVRTAGGPHRPGGSRPDRRRLALAVSPDRAGHTLKRMLSTSPSWTT